MSPARMDRLETAMRTILEYKECFNRHDVAAMLQLLSSDCILETASPTPSGSLISGKDAISQFYQDFFKTMPDIHLDIEEIYSIGYRCVMRWNSTRTETDGVSRHLRGVDLFDVKSTSIVEILTYIKG